MVTRRHGAPVKIVALATTASSAVPHVTEHSTERKYEITTTTTTTIVVVTTTSAETTTSSRC